MAGPTENNDPSKKWYACGSCRATYNTAEALCLHFKSHQIDNTFKCDVCSKSFPLEADFQTHLKAHPQELLCLTCDISFDTECEFRKHMGKHLQTCDECQRMFYTKKELSKHQKEEHKQESWQCDLCFRFYSGYGSLYHHKKNCHSSETFTCEECPNVYTLKRSLEKHVLVVHKNLKPFMCNQCGKGYCNRTSLAAHLLKHEGKQPYVCLICDKKFSDKRYFKVHGKSHAPSESSKKKCDVCAKEFANLPQLRLHMKIHDDTRPFFCSQCPKSFKFALKLKKHEETHIKEDAFQCGECGKKFKVERYLDRHFKTMHDRSARKLCTRCHKIFKSSSAFNHHIINCRDAPDQNDNKLQKCQLCRASFKFPYRLKRHMQRHLESKDYFCSHCDEQFQTGSDFVKHLKFHVGQRTDDLE